jgi:urease accessory protein
MDALSFIHGLQLTDSAFPVGAFAYSDGLETAASSCIVHDAASLTEWMDHFLDAVFTPCEGLALVKSMIALEAANFESLRDIDEELTAIRPSAGGRAASTGVGKRLLSLYTSICGDENFPTLAARLPHGNAAAAYGVVFCHRGLSRRDAVLAFGYNRLAGIVSAGLRLISIGHQQGQLILTKTIDRLPAAADRIMQMTGEPLRAFSPVLDIQQMNHQYVYSRLFRS